MSELYHQGGIVMIPLLLGSILAGMVIVERFLRLAGCQRGGPAFRTRLGELLAQGETTAARDWLKGQKGPVAAVALAAAQSWGRSDAALEAAMTAAARRSVPPLERHLTVLETAVTAAPLVGLLGTITGMMGVFRVVARRLAHDPGADTSHVTAGIGEALVATAFGILIAVVALLFFNAYRSFIDGLMDEAELVASELMMSREPAA